MKKYLLIGLVVAGATLGQKKDHGTDFIGPLIAGGATRTAPNKIGTSLPGTCVLGDTYIKTDATPAWGRLYVCTATDTWTQQTALENITLAGLNDVSAKKGNSTIVQMHDGNATTTNNCVKFDANGNTADAGAPCGSGGGGPSPAFPTLLDFEEEFCGTATGDTTANGQSQWGFSWRREISSGVLRDLQSIINHPCVIRMEANASANGYIALYQFRAFSGGSFRDMSSASFPNWTAYFVVRPQDTTNMRIYLGFSRTAQARNDLGGNASGFFVTYDTLRSSPDTTSWRYSICHNDGCSGSPDNSGVTVTANTWYVFRIRKQTTGTIDFATSTDGGATFGATQTACAGGECTMTATPTADTLGVLLQLGSSSGEADAKILDVDYQRTILETSLTRN